MHVIVIGAGEVGSYIAARLSREGHDVVIIDSDARSLREVEDSLDALAILGSGTNPSVLESAGVDRADLLVAATSNDAVNLVCSLVAKQHGVKSTVVRLEESELRSRRSKDIHQACGVDLIMDPDEETASEILELLEFPGATEIAEMAGGEVVIMGARLAANAPLVGQTLFEVAQEHEPQWEFLFGVVTRGDETIIPRGNLRLEAGDLVRVLCKKRARPELSKLLGLTQGIPKRVMLLGGGRTAEIVAERLDKRGATVVLVERDPARARELAEHLQRPMVLEGEITDADLLTDAEVGTFDAVIALTGEDDANILACLFAKLEGATETIAVAHRLSLLPLLREAGIDVALSPRTASANSVLRFVRGDVSAVATFLQADVEVLEVEVHEGSPADGSIIAELRIPKDVLIGAIVRDGKAYIARGRSQLRERDHVVVFAMAHAVGGVQELFG